MVPLADERRERHAVRDRLSEAGEVGVTPKSSCAPPFASRKPVTISSKTSSAPCSVSQLAHSLQVAGLRELDVTGSITTAATSSGARRTMRSSASRSL